MKHGRPPCSVAYADNVYCTQSSATNHNVHSSGFIQEKYNDILVSYPHELIYICGI